MALLRGTTADTYGNVTMEREVGAFEVLSIAQATKNSGGIDIVQVERIVEERTLHPQMVKVPGVLVSAVVVGRHDNHQQTFAEAYNPAYCGEAQNAQAVLSPLPLDERKLIARRAAFELTPQAVLNLGIGMPEGIARVAHDEGVLDDVVLSVESGPIGGIPAGGLGFGASANPDAIVDQPCQFDYYDGGGLDIAFLGMGQVDRLGNVNVSKFGARVAGVGGFVDISQNSKRVIFCGTFTAGGLNIEIADAGLRVVREGTHRRFLNSVEQISFSGEKAIADNRRVLYVTERAVFRLGPQGLLLQEVAPGIDLQRDVLEQMDFTPVISDPLSTMDVRIFRESPMGLVLGSTKGIR